MLEISRIITVGLNPAIDLTLEAPGLTSGAHIQGRVLARQPAGKAVNVSRTLALLGRDSIATGFIGGQERAEYAAFLHRAGPGRITCDLLPVTGPTRQNLTLVDPVNRTDTHIRDVGLTVSSGEVQVLRKQLAELASASSLSIFSGSLPRGVGLAEFIELIQTVVAAGGHSALDLSGEALRQVVQNPPANIWLLKPNRAELVAALGLPQDVEPAELERCALQLAGTINFVAVSLGAEGAILAHRRQLWRGRIPVAPGKIIDTVGCGDALLAGLLDGYLAGLPPAAMLRRGLAVATANACVAGAANFAVGLATELEHAAEVKER